MNEKQFENKMEKDGENIKNAFQTMVGNGAAQIKDEYEQFSGSVKDNVKDASSLLKKRANDGMKHYNSKAQQMIDKLPSGFRKTMSKYPWVIVSLGLVFGFMLGIILKPSQQSR